MATDPVELHRPVLDEVVARTRRDLEARGALQPPAAGGFRSPLDEEERAAVLEALESGAYDRAVAELATEDPELS